jgi:subtilisin family serine protease
VSSGSAAVVISGQWKQGRSFVLHLEGQGSAQIWIEGAGAVAPGAGGGVFLPRSTKEGTITIPASDPNLIAVGATLNRTNWPSDSDEAMNLVPALEVPPDSVAYFSSAGPNSQGALKPELVAPGAYVVGAMSRDADPREDPFSVFASAECSDPGCRVVDDEHAVGSGTSMAAPLVTGASALLLQRDPTLTAPRVRALLMAGSRAVSGSVAEAQQAGAGVLDIVGSLRVQDRWASGAESDTATPAPEHTRLVLASSFVRPDPAWPLSALLLLRDADDRLSDPAPARVQLVAKGADSSKFDRIAPGLWQLSIAAPADAGGKTLALRILVDDALVATHDVRVAVDPAVARAGFSAQGGCTLARGDREPNPWWLVFGGVGLAARFRRCRKPRG